MVGWSRKAARSKFIVIRFPRSVLRSGIWAAGIALLLLPMLGRAQDSPKADEEEMAKYSSEIEAKFEELMKKVGEAKSTDESALLKRETADSVKVTGLDETGQKALDAAAAAAIEASVKEWQKKAETSLRTNSGPNVEVETLDVWIAQASTFFRNDNSLDYTKPSDQPAWKDALARVLTPAQAEAWKADVAERRRKFEEETKGVVAATKARLREQDVLDISGKVSVIVQTLSLDEARTKKLQKVGEQAADKASEGVGERARATLLRLAESARKQTLKTNSLYLAPDEKTGPEMQVIWKDGLKEILTPEETQRWQAVLDQREVRRYSKLARMLVWALDQGVAFTSSQREQIRPIAERCVREKKTFFVERRGDGYTSYSVETFYQVAKAAKDEELKKILDEKQVARWKALAARQTASQRLVALRARTAAAAKEQTKLAAFEPEELEGAISDQLAEMADREQQTTLANFLLQAEDAIRVAGVEGKAVQLLQTAARGAMEAEFESWRDNMAGNIRSQLQGATPADFQQRMQNIGMNTVGRRRPSASAGNDGIWQKTVATELTEAQRAAWKKETDARDADEQQTSLDVLIGEVDRICTLTEEQRAKFEAVLVGHLKEYEPELRNMFSQGNNGWFLMGYYMLTPVGGIGEKELRKILTDGQWKALSGSQQYSNAARYWENIEQSHKQRVKEKEKK